MSKDYEEHLGIRKIGEILIDGKRVESLEMKTTTQPSL